MAGYCFDPRWRNPFDKIIDWLVARRDERRRKRWIADEETARAKSYAGTLTDKELIYAAYARCPCGAGMAYAKGIGAHGFWDCSDVLTGRAKPNVVHDARLQFVFWSIKSEQQTSANGATTRPK